MLKEALQYIIGLSNPTVQKINGETYSDKLLHRINHNPKADPIKLNTLSSLVEYLKSGIDILPECLFIHVQSPTRVCVFSPLDRDRDREYLIEVNAQVPAFNFDHFIDHETFCINLQSKFLDSTDRALLLKFAGTVEAGSIAEYGDDGVSQKATVKTGIASKGDALVPSPVALVPFRTFVEVQQPLSSFVFRMKQDKYDGINCALFEADGGAWKISAMTGIKAYLENELSEFSNFVVIS
jgi:hypothetical protein